MMAVVEVREEVNDPRSEGQQEIGAGLEEHVNGAFGPPVALEYDKDDDEVTR